MALKNKVAEVRSDSLSKNRFQIPDIFINLLIAVLAMFFQKDKKSNF